MSDIKQVKVDNWGIYFLQRLKHFFNRTDYCDLTLQFQDNAQLKVHRLVLSACTEYFELLERTCEMYEDCLVMPDDLQADVVVPIVNFMYTGQLEFKSDTLEKLYQTALVMNMPVLSKLLEVHRTKVNKSSTAHQSYAGQKRSSRLDSVKQTRHQTPPPVRSQSTSNKRSYSKAFSQSTSTSKDISFATPERGASPGPNYKAAVRADSPPPINFPINNKSLREPRPTRYELPEELDTDNVFENSFSSISYTSKPLMVHPETTKHYPSKKNSLFMDASDSRKSVKRASTMDIVECKRIVKNDNIFDDITEHTNDEVEISQTSYRDESMKDSSQLFDQIMNITDNGGPKVTIETKDSKQANNIDHAKIISEVLKKYPHLVKSNKNIKLKILNTPAKTKKSRTTSAFVEEKEMRMKEEVPDYTYETDVLDSKEAAKLIAMGAENVKGPWICLICGTPGRALHFTTYYKFRRHLVDVHNEKPVPTICEYCGFRSFKRNYMLHHCYTKHGVEPPSQYNFPKCKLCDYVAITEGFLIKHKLSAHMDHKNFRCNVCFSSFNTTSQLLVHVQKTGHKHGADKKNNLQCIYCLKVFLRDGNLYTHLKTNHKRAAKRDGLIDDSDDERQKVTEVIKAESLKYDAPVFYDNENEDGDMQYQIQAKDDGYQIQPVVSKKIPINQSGSPQKQKILNPGFSSPSSKVNKPKTIRNVTNIHNEFLQDNNTLSPTNPAPEESVVIIGGTEYIMKPRDKEFIIPDMLHSDTNQSEDTIAPSTSMQYTAVTNTDNLQASKMHILKKSNMSQPIQIVVSNEEQYKALMSSNHTNQCSIIFNDGDTNKTLTVMADNTLDSAAIDLDTTQPNEMMIIPDDYSLNVAEASDNSNIVVVYHDSDPSKQYQIISSQDIGAQYVQSSAIITQNFETVTTSTPVMSAHVIEAQVDDSWQNTGQSIDNQPVHITSDVQLQSIVAQAQQIKNETNNLIDLPKVQLIPEPKEINETSEINAVNEEFNQSNVMAVENMIEDNTEQVAANEMHNITDAPISTDIPCDKDKEDDVPAATVDETIETAATEIPMDITPESQDVIATIQDQPEDDASVLNSQDVSDKIEENSEETTETEAETLEDEHEDPISLIPAEAENSQENDNVTDQPSVITSIIDKDMPPPKITNEQIKDLTSEWSEDEFDNANQETIGEIAAREVNNKVSVSSASPEIEESIENIQQEMQKQIATCNNEDDERTPTESSSPDLKEPEKQLTNDELTNELSVETPPAQKKLSSLLNDWEDNDSQEENNSTADNEQENVADTSLPSNVETENVPEEEEGTEKSVPKKENNIRSLVSDWDDDDEENKE